MKERITQYIDYIDKLLEEDDRDWDEEMRRHLIQIRFFAHERLVHLIVFALVAMCLVLSVLAIVAYDKVILIPLMLVLFILTLAYCMHYYLLENSVQKMYDQYDMMMEKAGKQAFKVVNDSLNSKYREMKQMQKESE